MNQNPPWELLFKNHEYPCMILHKEQYKLLYFNEKYGKLFAYTEDSIEKCLHELVKPEDVQIKGEFPDWDLMESYTTECYDKKLNATFIVNCALIENRTAIFYEFVPAETAQENLHFEEAMTRCMEIYQQPPESILISMLELLADFYQCHRAYVYRLNFTDYTINCVAQWCSDPTYRVVQEVGTKMDATHLIGWIQNESEAGIVRADRNAEDFDSTSTIASIMDTFHMENIILCTVEDVDHNVVGVVGITDREDTASKFDPRLITTISRFVAQEVNRSATDEALFKLHFRDSLTGFYNRSGYAQRIDEILKGSPKTMGAILANINGLKIINEKHGILAGDEHIKKSAKRIKKHFGFEFFRMSGDELLGISPDMSEEDFESLVMSLHEEMKAEENYDFSFGHSWRSGKIEVGKLLQEADTVMYINKQEYYANSDRKFDSVKDSTLSDLLSYLENNEFMIYLQPQVKLEDGSLYGAEALIRRFDKTNQKMVFPDQFISLYEQKSVIRHVDIFVVEEVCRLLQAWQKEGKALPISVNLSRVTLMEYGIVEAVAEICDRYAVNRSYLVIEVTERVGLIENNVASSLVVDFIQHGFRISLDDFGCAYSNIVTLAQIDVDEVKLDKSLVDNLTVSVKNKVLVRNVLRMCNELESTSTLAEGIEDQEQSEMLHSMGCHLGQGYFYSRPIPVPDFVAQYLQ